MISESGSILESNTFNFLIFCSKVPISLIACATNKRTAKLEQALGDQYSRRDLKRASLSVNKIKKSIQFADIELILRFTARLFIAA